MSPNRSVSFGAVEIEDGLHVNTETIEMDVPSVDEGPVVIGEYDYESEGMFGSPTTASHEVVYDYEANILGVVTVYDQPKAKTIFRNLNEEAGLDITAPEYSASASHDFFRTYGFNGYTVSFRDGLLDFTYDTDVQHRKPEDKAEEIAMHSDQRMSDTLVEEITEEFIDEGYHVESMDMRLEEDGVMLSFDSPLRFVGFDDDEWTQENIELMVRRARELLNDDVKTVEEVLAEN